MALEAARSYDALFEHYDEWYEENKALFLSELRLIESVLPTGTGLEIGVGTGVFASHFSITIGIDPSRNMLFRAKQRGIAVVQGVGEALPFRSSTFDFVLFVTAFCFLERPDEALEDVKRVLKSDGALVIAFIDKNGGIGQRYEAKKAHNPAYRYAHFYAPDELASLLQKHGFTVIETRQTLFEDAAPDEIQEPKKGRGEGGFVALRAIISDKA